MSEERTKILRMLQEGKITVEDAARLIEAIEGAAPGENKPEREPDFHQSQGSGSNEDSDGHESGLRGISFQGVNLHGTHFQGAKFEGIKLGETNLEGANLQDADLRNADLRDANLEGANLQGADFHGADLQGVDLTGVNMAGLKYQERNRVRVRS